MRGRAAGKKQREELDARISYLKDLDKNLDAPGPLIDAVVWHDGSVWRAALDTTECQPPESAGAGALADATPMTDYRTERQHGTFSLADSCTFVTNIYDNGDILSIVVDAGVCCGAAVLLVVRGIYIISLGQDSVKVG